jgi:glycosyltransferase 2 family protein
MLMSRLSATEGFDLRGPGDGPITIQAVERAATTGLAKHALRVAATLALTGLFAAYLIWKIDLSRTVETITHARLGYLLAALGILFAIVWPISWRWQLLLRARGIEERLPWLTRAYFVSYAAGQVLPTSVGGDATRIYETSRRHRGRTADIAASVLLERLLGGVATLLLAAVGFLLAIGHYDVGAYLWVELAFVVVAIVAGVVLFARSARPVLARFVPLLSRLRLDRPLRSVYEALHLYRRDVSLLARVFMITLVVQVFRVLTIWLAGKAVHVDLSPRPYFVMGPLLFLVMLVPLTINGFAVRESLFVSFLGKLGIGANRAFSAGFLYFALSIALGIPGALILLRESARGLRPRPRVP